MPNETAAPLFSFYFFLNQLLLPGFEIVIILGGSTVCGPSISPPADSSLHGVLQSGQNTSTADISRKIAPQSGQVYSITALCLYLVFKEGDINLSKVFPEYVLLLSIKYHSRREKPGTVACVNRQIIADDLDRRFFVQVYSLGIVWAYHGDTAQIT